MHFVHWVLSLPPQNNVVLWSVKHDDGDLEDLNEAELLEAMEAADNDPRANLRRRSLTPGMYNVDAIEKQNSHKRVAAERNTRKSSARQARKGNSSRTPERGRASSNNNRGRRQNQRTASRSSRTNGVQHALRERQPPVIDSGDDMELTQPTRKGGNNGKGFTMRPRHDNLHRMFQAKKLARSRRNFVHRKRKDGNKSDSSSNSSSSNSGSSSSTSSSHSSSSSDSDSDSDTSARRHKRKKEKKRSELEGGDIGGRQKSPRRDTKHGNSFSNKHSTKKHHKQRSNESSGVNGKVELADTGPLRVDANDAGFQVVGGLDHHVNALKEMVLLPMLYPEAFARFGVSPPRGVLFYGPPGTGKDGSLQ
jgi:SpoVK/Ycf46/Vps4 family AAA+-type ATPase